MNIVLIIPTGIGAEIGGHAGDANPVAKLIASACDKLIVHPNVVNASDVNEMPDNCLYVEGSILDRFLEGKIGLKEVKRNKVLVAVNRPVKNETINAINSAMVTIGMCVEIMPLDIELKMVGTIINNVATGEVNGWEELVKQTLEYDFDALAIASKIDVDRNVTLSYLKNGGINPWGGVEAKASKLIATALDKPVAHAPVINCTIESDPELYLFSEIVDPRIAPEAISMCYLHCILKGLQNAPRIGNDLTVDDIDMMITPANCVGRPHQACIDNNIEVIAVKENKTVLNDKMPNSFIVVDNYLEAVGMIISLKAGIFPETVRRPLNNCIEVK